MAGAVGGDAVRPRGVTSRLTLARSLQPPTCAVPNGVGPAPAAMPFAFGRRGIGLLLPCSPSRP